LANEFNALANLPTAAVDCTIPLILANCFIFYKYSSLALLANSKAEAASFALACV